MIKINIEGYKLEVQKEYFPCGELMVKLPEEDLPDSPDKVILTLVYETNDDLMLLLLVNNALKNIYEACVQFTLIVGYFPYGRQDRVSNSGEPHSLSVACQMINLCAFYRVAVIDPHSDVIEALINDVTIVDMNTVLENFKNIFEGIDKLVSPDAGAYKKVGKLARNLGYDVIRSDKVRDTKTGQISNIEVYAEDLTGLSVLICDDICDGGGTFVGLAKKLKEKGAERVVLYTSHGMYTKGIDILLENGVDSVVCYDYYGDLGNKHKVTILNEL